MAAVRSEAVPTGLQLVVLSGFHAGARCDVLPGACLVGSDLSDTVILADPGIVPGHLILEAEGTTITIRTARDGVALNGIDVSPDDPVMPALPFELAFAGVSLRCELSGDHAAGAAIDDADDVSDQPLVSRPRASKFGHALRRGRRLPAAACALVVMGLLVPGVQSIASSASGPDLLAETVSQTMVATRAELAVPDHVTPRVQANTTQREATATKGLGTALEELQAELGNRSLQGVQLVASGGTITARGRLNPRNEPEWRLAQQWFDGRYDQYGHQATLVDEVQFLPSAAMVAMDAVWVGRNPNVVIKGQKFFEGATLPGGFRLERILPGELIVEREGQRQVFRF